MLRVIEDLAKKIDRAWSHLDYTDRAFPDLAAEALNQPLDLDFTTVAKCVCEGAPLPEQRRLDEGFGQPAITLYRSERFLIEALCWHTSTPAIHQHAFSGAFRLVTGRSVHSRYAYQEHDRLGRLSLGSLTLQSADVLNETAAHPIPRGADLIHANFHLDSPTMTLVVRTHQGAEPELSYLPPGIAYDPAERDQSFQKRAELLDTMHQTEHRCYKDCIRAAIANSDEYGGMMLLLRAGARVDEGTFCELTMQLQARHGEMAARVLAALKEERRRGALVRLRSSMTDADSRFFLATLLSFSQRADVIQTMAQHYGGRDAARERIAEGVAQLLGGDRDRRIIAAAAATAMLDDIPAQEFAPWAARRWNRILPEEEAQALIRFYAQLKGHSWLTPLVM